jgi:YqaJ-like viral recombinase domain
MEIDIEQRTEEWNILRRCFITGTKFAVIMGKNPYMSVSDLLDQMERERLGLPPKEMTKQSLRNVEWGNVHEKDGIQEYEMKILGRFPPAPPTSAFPCLTDSSTTPTPMTPSSTFLSPNLSSPIPTITLNPSSCPTSTSTEESSCMASSSITETPISMTESETSTTMTESTTHDACCVRHVGFIIDRQTYKFGVSPDGLVGDDGIVEIKCPVSRKFYPKIPEYYEYQVCALLGVTQRKWCDLVQWTPFLGISVKRYTLDVKLWDEMKEAGLKFYDLYKDHFHMMKKILFLSTSIFPNKKHKREDSQDESQDESQDSEE